MNQTNDDEDVHITENDLPQEFILKVLGQREARGMWGIKNTREPVDAMVKYAKSRELSLPLVQVVITKEGIFVNPIASRFECQVQEGGSVSGTLSKPISERCRIHSNRDRIPQNGTHDGRPAVQWSTGPQFKTTSTNSSQGSRNFSNGGPEPKSTGKFNFGFRKREDEKTRKRPATDLRILEKFSRFDWTRAGILFFGIDTISYGVQDLIFTRVFSMIVVLDRRTRAALGANSAFMCHSFVCESRSTAKKVTYALSAAFQAYGRAVKDLQENETSGKVIPEAKPKKFTIELRSPSELDFDVSEA